MCGQGGRPSAPLEIQRAQQLPDLFGCEREHRSPRNLSYACSEESHHVTGFGSLHFQTQEAPRGPPTAPKRRVDLRPPSAPRVHRVHPALHLGLQVQLGSNPHPHLRVMQNVTFGDILTGVLKEMAVSLSKWTSTPSRGQLRCLMWKWRRLPRGCRDLLWAWRRLCLRLRLLRLRLTSSRRLCWRARK